MRGRTVGHTDCEGNQEPTGGDAQQLPGLGSMLLDPLPDIDPVLLMTTTVKAHQLPESDTDKKGCCKSC